MTRLTALYTIVLLFLIANSSCAQSGTIAPGAYGGADRDWQFNYNLGFSQFYGDASNTGFFTKLSGESAFGTGIHIRKYVSPIMALGGAFLYSGVKSHKVKSATGATVDFTLSGSFYDVGVDLYTDLSGLFWGPSDRTMNLYGTIGLGYASWKTELADNLAGSIVVSGDAVNGVTTKKGGAVVPIALGVNFKLGPNWGLNLESSLHTVLNDDVDMWTDGFKYDQMLYTQVGISYYLNSGQQNKKDRKPRGERPQSTDCNKQPIPTDVIPLYDYKKQPPKPSGGGVVTGRQVETLTIAQPTTPPATDYRRGIVYRVQVLAKSQALPSVAYIKNQFDITTDVYENYQDGVYRYSAGSFSTYREALAYSQELRSRGIHDAFVVVYQNNVRIKLTDDLKR